MGLIRPFLRSQLLGLVLLLAVLGPTSTAQAALDRDTRAVLVASTWGLAAGSVLGVGGWAFSHNAKTLFQGSSLGLYFGIAFGLYHITHRDDPSNPLRAEAGTPSGNGSSAARLDPIKTEEGARLQRSPPLIEAQWIVLRF